MSIVEETFGKGVHWALTLLIALWTLVGAFNAFDGRHRDERTDLLIIENCAGYDNVEACIEEIKKAL